MVKQIKVKKLDKEASLPEYALDSDVCFDIRANKNTVIRSMEQKEISTGLAIEIPKGYVGLVRDRIGIVTKLGCHVIAGTFDSSYREEVTIVMINFGVDEIEIEEGMKIAQILIMPVNKMKIKEVKTLSITKRSGKKFGLTGLK
jgi:dUTP pyrophosphatase